MNFNFANTGIFPGQVVPAAMGFGPSTTAKGRGTGSEFAVRLKALLSGNNSQTSAFVDFFQGKLDSGLSGKNNSSIQSSVHSSILGKILKSGGVRGKGIPVNESTVADNGKNMQESIKTNDGKRILLPISTLPILSSLLGAFQVPEQYSTALINDAKEERVGIDLDRLIKGFQALQQDAFFAGAKLMVSPEIKGTGGAETRWIKQMFTSLGLEAGEKDFRSLTLGDFVTALEQKRLSLAGASESETGVALGVETDLDRLITSLEQLQHEDSDSVPQDLAGFVSLLKELRVAFAVGAGGNQPVGVHFDEMTSGSVTNGKIDYDNDISTEIKINLDNFFRQIRFLENQEISPRFLTSGDFVPALEKQRVLPGTGSLDSSLSELSGKSDAESLLNRLMAFFNARGEHFQSFEKQEISPRFLTPGDFVPALEKQSVLPGTDSFDSSLSELSGKSDAESLLNRLMAVFNPKGEQPGKPGEMTLQVWTGTGTGTGEHPVSFADIRAVPDPKARMNHGIQTGVDPEPARFMENVAALVKEMKINVDDTRNIGREANQGAGGKEIAKGGTAIDAAGGAGGESRQMWMNSRGQAVSNQGSSRSALPTYVTNQVGKSLARAVSQGDTELKLQLRPPELGRILMTIDNRGNSIKVSVITENQAAKEILAAHAHELKTTLAGSGIVIGSFDVEMGSDFNQSMADARQNFKGSGSKSGRGDGTGAALGENDSSADLRGFSGDDRSLHFVA